MIYLIEIERSGKQFYARIRYNDEIVWTSETRKNRVDVWEQCVNMIRLMSGAKIKDNTGLKRPKKPVFADYEYKGV